MTSAQPNGAERLTGVVKWFDQARGFGFIIPANGAEHHPLIAQNKNPDVFVHARQVKTFPKVLQPLDQVEFTPAETRRNVVEAIAVKILSRPGPSVPSVQSAS